MPDKKEAPINENATADVDVAPLILTVAIDKETGATNIASSSITEERDFTMLLQVLGQLQQSINAQYIQFIKEHPNGKQHQSPRPPS